MASGLPSIASLKPVLQFIAVPAVLVVLIVLTGGQWPKPVLYGIALLLGVWLAASALRSPELIVACTLFYLPFSTTYAIGIAPGINGTNILLLMGLVACLIQAMSRQQKLLDWLPGTRLVLFFGFYTALSGITVMTQPGGWRYLIHGEILNYKGWLDQFVFYCVLASTIRDRDMAKRMLIYMVIGAMVLAVYTIPEMLEKAGRSSIEKSRLEGPHQQTNNFGGFVAYTLMPVVAIFITYIRDWRAWLLTPSILLAAKLLLATFSRGAYLAMALGGFIAAYFRGKGFLTFWVTIGIVGLIMFPQFIPGSISARMASLIEAGESTSVSTEEKLDKSSQHRLILWRAAGLMIQEDPVFGKGYKAFQMLKSEYTEHDVHESDPHNMYLFIAAQMGLPAMFMFVWIMLLMFHYGRQAARQRQDRFVRAIGIGAAGASACYGVICMFGSRAVNLEFSAYFWTLFVIMQVLHADKSLAVKPGRRMRVRNVDAFTDSDHEPDGADSSRGVPDGALQDQARPGHRWRTGRRRGRRAGSGGRGHQRRIRGTGNQPVRRRQNAFRALKTRYPSSYSESNE